MTEIRDVDSLPGGSTGVALRDEPRRAIRAADLTVPDGAGSITRLLELAIEKNMPIESLGKLVELQEKMLAIDARNQFNLALARFQELCPPIKKARTANIATKSGGAYSFTYAELEEIQATVNPVLTPLGLSYSFSSSATEKLLTVVCTLAHIAGHSVSSSITLPVDNPSGASPQQKYGMAHTYGMRRTLAAVLGLTMTDDDVGEATAKDLDPKKLDEDQITAIEDLLETTGSDRARFLKFMGAERLEDLRVGEYERAINTIHQIDAARKGRGGAK